MMMFDESPQAQQDKRGYTSVKNDQEFDIESGETLYPGLSVGENQLRWGFIRKVYGILCAQILLTTVVSVMFFPLGPAAHAIYGGIGAMIFSAYIVYDTDNLIKRFTYDEYIGASVTLYLDILNLFLSILRILREANN
ncbi:hypothetical protein RYX36_001597 [Vicia faba]